MALEVIARSREQGVLQSELPKLLRKPPTHFSYTLRKLACLGLVTKTPLKLRVPGAAGGVSATALLHHVRFAPGTSPAPVAALVAAAESGLVQVRPGCHILLAGGCMYRSTGNVWQTTPKQSPGI